MGPFKQRFGTYNPKTKTYALPSSFLSYSNAFPFLLLICGALLDGNGHASTYSRCNHRRSDLFEAWSPHDCVRHVDLGFDLRTHHHHLQAPQPVPRCTLLELAVHRESQRC